MSSDTEIIELNLLAGFHPNGQPVVEKLRALPELDKNCFRLLQSPLFVTGAACGDLIEMSANNPGRFRVRERSGQLAIRVLSRNNIADIAEELTPAIEMLDGVLEVQTKNALVYSIHVAVGFDEIEGVLNPVVSKFTMAQWSYGNVYDPESGAPLNWWEALLNP